MLEFFETIPPGQGVAIKSLYERKSTSSGAPYHVLRLPALHLYCDTVTSCEGIRRFRATEEISIQIGQTQERFVVYICKNCSATSKTFALRIKPNTNDEGGVIIKYGEIPGFGPPTPARLTRLLGVDAPLFLKGRMAENQGMGIGAFAYYRRVIESQKDALFDEIIRVSKAIGATEIIAGLEAGKKQIQFSSAIEQVEIALPPVLMINGCNPLTLLHGALSKGLHSGTDADCLANATDTRVVLTEFVTRMAEAMKDDVELKSAVSRLANIKRAAKPWNDA